MEGSSNCYDREEENCKVYGRLYTQGAAQEACPEGSHLSTDEDWKALEAFAGGASVAAEKLRSFGNICVMGNEAAMNGLDLIIETLT